MNNRGEKTLPKEGIRVEAHVVWADGLGDTNRQCEVCWSNTCVKPVHKDSYTVLLNSDAKKWDDENPVI